VFWLTDCVMRWSIGWCASSRRCASRSHCSCQTYTSRLMRWVMFTWPTSADTTTPHPRVFWNRSNSTRICCRPSSTSCRRKLCVLRTVSRSLRAPLLRLVLRGSVFASGLYFRLFWPQLGLRPRSRPAASFLSCGPSFRPFGPQLGLQPQFLVLRASAWSGLLSSVMDAPVCIAALMMRHHSDDVYMTSQPIVAHSSAAA